MGADEAATMRIVAANEEIHRAALGRHRGQLIQLMGDGVLASFDSASDAVAAAREIQRAVGDDGRFEVRVGIHLGEVTRDSGRVLGDGVNIAARIQAEMGPGEIGVSGVVYDNVRNKEGVSATLIGERTLKGVADPIALYSVTV
jgi:class 3 adenylate cyclase